MEQWIIIIDSKVAIDKNVNAYPYLKKRMKEKQHFACVLK